MTPLVHTEKDRERLAFIAAGWIGTPFAVRSAVKGHGVDCVNLCKHILLEFGAKGFPSVPVYRVGEVRDEQNSALVGWFDSATGFQHVGPLGVQRMGVEIVALVRPGDLLLFRVGHSDHLALIVHGSSFIHAINGALVTMGDLREPAWLKRLVAVRRPLGQPCQ